MVLLKQGPTAAVTNCFKGLFMVLLLKGLKDTRAFWYKSLLIRGHTDTRAYYLKGLLLQKLTNSRVYYMVLLKQELTDTRAYCCSCQLLQGPIHGPTIKGPNWYKGLLIQGLTDTRAYYYLIGCHICYLIRSIQIQTHPMPQYSLMRISIIALGECVQRHSPVQGRRVKNFLSWI